jgi:hypothetical protein
MPALPVVAAMINNGEVVNVGALSTENDYSEWLESAKKEYDDVLLVTHAGIGWKVTDDGLRPENPYPSWVWNENNGWYEAPIPYPSGGGLYEWNETTQDWAPLN